MLNKDKILTVDEFYKNDNITPYFRSEINTFEKVIHEMTKVMNEIHNTNYSYRFWKLILIEYINRKQLRRPIINQPLEYNPSTVKEKYANKIVYLIKAYKNRGNKQIILDALKTNTDITHGFHDSKIISKEVGIAVPEYFPVFLTKGDTTKRKRALEIAARYSSEFYRRVISELSANVVEHFDTLMEMIPLHSPEKKTFHTSFTNAEFMKLVIAKHVENGSAHYIYQHGGGAGEVYDRAIFHDATMSDKYITWGWKLHDNEIESKAYRCEKFKGIYDTTPNTKEIDCLFAFNVICSDGPFYKEFMHNIQVNFDKSKYTNVIARPRVTSKWKDAKKDLSFLDHSFYKIDSGKTKVANLVKRSKIVVTFSWVSPQTLFAECVYVNHPVVSFVKELDKTTIFEPYYDFFIKNKVYHENWDTLVEHLNTTNIDEWWSKLIQTPEYNEFKYKFARNI